MKLFLNLFLIKCGQFSNSFANFQTNPTACMLSESTKAAEHLKNGEKYAKQNTPTHLGRLRLFYPSGNEGGAGVLRCHHAVGGTRGVGGGALEAGDPLGD